MELEFERRLKDELEHYKEKHKLTLDNICLQCKVEMLEADVKRLERFIDYLKKQIDVLEKI